MIIDFLSRGANEDFSNPVFYCLKKNGEKNKKTLLIVATVLIIGAISFCYFVFWMVQRTFVNSAPCKKSYEIVCQNPQVNAFHGENIQQKGYVSGSVNANLGGVYAKLYLIRLKLLIYCKIKDFSNAKSEKNTIFLDLIPKKTRFFWI
ncbi:MAG: hypothetical protein IJ150_04010 [Bacteroidales bacterium]|nr:hypothetical protein [Bacteroidales bacterium]